MITKVTVSINDEDWEFTREGNQSRGISKKDKSFLQNVVKVLEDALEQTKGQLGLSGNEG